jgi:hypothetical protein
MSDDDDRLADERRRRLDEGRADALARLRARGAWTARERIAVAMDAIHADPDYVEATQRLNAKGPAIDHVEASILRSLPCSPLETPQ